VPKAAIDEYGDPLALKYEVWPADDRNVTSPATQAILPKQDSQREFGFFVSLAAYATHDFRTLLCREYVGHADYASLLKPRR
jgi:hypothetical protein